MFGYSKPINLADDLKIKNFSTGIEVIPFSKDSSNEEYNDLFHYFKNSVQL